MKLITTLFIFTILNLGCSHGVIITGNMVKVKKSHTQYGLTLLPEIWQKTGFRGADLFFKHKKFDATIYVNAQCEKVSDSPLEALTAQMLVGMGKYSIISEKFLDLNGREALITDVDAKLDGVNRYLKIMVMRKNKCIYDAVLSAYSNTIDITKDFDDMVTTFWAEADL